MELLERAATAASPLLRTEQASAPGNSDPFALLLTFDLGRILVSPGGPDGGVREELVSNPEELPLSFEQVDEEEPWWRVVGNPLTRVRELRVGESRGIVLQFRTDGDNPRLVAILPEAEGLRVHLQGSPVA